MKKKKFEHPRMLGLEIKQNNVSCNPGDEFVRNGIFEFNVSGVNEYINENEADFELVEIPVDYYFSYFSRSDLQPEWIEKADIDRPVLLFEIAPDRKYYSDDPIVDDFYDRGYNVLDGSHRLAKAKQQGIQTIKAYLVPMETHIKFMTNGFEAYVSYWNDKLKTGQAAPPRR
ncbi:MAG: ParB/RepB/Spo0J family partition protein [Clostridia bacterium]|nr:ParB/RepB/Spo0J family partition protein [Clostridia bacterium]